MNSREQLRTFHLTGKGLEQYATGALRPVGLDGLPELQSVFPFRLRDGTAVSFSPNAVPMMLCAAVAPVRRQAREPLRMRVRQALNKMKDLLAVDDSRAADSPDSIVASLGVEAGFFNAGALAVAVKSSAKGTHGMEPERRARIEQAAATLERFLRESEGAPVCWLFHSGSEPADVAAMGGRSLQVSEAVSSAVRFCRKELDQFGEVLRALRVARLEAESDYVPDVHDERIARVDWRAAEESELAALPAVAALAESGEDLGPLVRSGLPVQAVIRTPGFANADLGYQAMAHREAFVLQGSLAEPAGLMAGLEEMAAAEGPAVAVVSVPADGAGEEQGWRECAALARSRSFPLFRYNPALGEKLAERFAFHDGDTKLTPADAAAVLACESHQFRLLPESEWNDEQMEWNEYAAACQKQAPPAIPFLWTTDKRRAVMTREVAERCLDRRRALRLLEELAGIGNSFVDRAVAETKQAMEQQCVAREQTAFERGRQEGVQHAVAKLVTALMNPSRVGPASAGARLQPRPPVETPSPKAAAAVAVAVEAPAIADAYIDSFLCTSCNDCMKVNAKLFLYNSDKQAYLGDLSAGTFADLVKAAEGCPAKCIHPGKPRAGDPTATPAMVARAAKLG